MTYDLAIWEGKRPSGATAATDFEAIYDHYIAAGVNVPPTPAIRRLVDELVLRWGDLGDDLDNADQDIDSGSEECPWADGPLLNNAVGPIVYLSVRPSAAEAISSEVAEMANEQGLVCFDPQSGQLRPSLRMDGWAAPRSLRPPGSLRPSPSTSTVHGEVTLTSLTKDSLAECARSLKAIGFTKERSSNRFSKSYAGREATAIVSFNVISAGLPEELEINPIVGVRHPALEALLLELAPDWKAPIVIAREPLGYLMPINQFVTWTFIQGTDLAGTADTLAEAVSRYGEPYIDHWSDWENFRNAIASSDLMLEGEAQFVHPMMAILASDVERAKRLVDQEMERISGFDDFLSDSYRQFAERFRLKLEC